MDSNLPLRQNAVGDQKSCEFILRLKSHRGELWGVAVVVKEATTNGHAPRGEVIGSFVRMVLNNGCFERRYESPLSRQRGRDTNLLVAHVHPVQYDTLDFRQIRAFINTIVNESVHCGLSPTSLLTYPPAESLQHCKNLLMPS